MNSISKADFFHLPNEDAKNLIPIILLYDGEPFAMVCKPEDVIFIQDFHPWVKRQFKAQEAKVRMGMPKKEEETKRIYLNDFKKAEA